MLRRIAERVVRIVLVLLTILLVLGSVYHVGYEHGQRDMLEEMLKPAEYSSVKMLIDDPVELENQARKHRVNDVLASIKGMHK